VKRIGISFVLILLMGCQSSQYKKVSLKKDIKIDRISILNMEPSSAEIQYQTNRGSTAGLIGAVIGAAMDEADRKELEKLYLDKLNSNKLEFSMIESIKTGLAKNGVYSFDYEQNINVPVEYWEDTELMKKSLKKYKTQRKLHTDNFQNAIQSSKNRYVLLVQAKHWGLSYDMSENFLQQTGKYFVHARFTLIDKEQVVEKNSNSDPKNLIKWKIMWEFNEYGKIDLGNHLGTTKDNMLKEEDIKLSLQKISKDLAEMAVAHLHNVDMEKNK